MKTNHSNISNTPPTSGRSRRRTFHVWWSAAALALCVTPLQAAAIVPVGQSRSVSTVVNVSIPPLSNYVAAAGFGAFDQTNTLSGFALPRHPYLVSAGQSSQIGASTIAATGMVDDEPGIVSGSADSDFRVTFRLTAPVTYTLAGSLIWSETLMYSAGPPAPFVRLSNAGGVIFETPAPTPDGVQLDYSTNGTLPAGEYTLEAHANSTVPNGYDVSLMNYDLAFNAVATGPVQNAGQVYPLCGGLFGVVQNGGTNRLAVIAAHDLVNAALGRSLFNASIPTRQVLALVSDTINHNVRLAVWDKTTSNVVAEVGPVTFQSGLLTGRSYTAIGDVAMNNTGRLLEVAGDVKTRLTLASIGQRDNTGAITTLSAAPVIGQINFIDDRGATNMVLVKSGTLWTGRKIGTTP